MQYALALSVDELLPSPGSFKLRRSKHDLLDHQETHRDVIAKQSAQRNCVYNASAKLYKTSGLSDNPNSSTSRLRVKACSSVCLYFRSLEV
jgi:hypothetical protein